LEAIGLAVNKTAVAVKRYYQRYLKIKDLPPKIKVDRSITKGRTGPLITRIVQESPKISYRDIPAELKKRLPPGTAIPGFMSCRRYLQNHSFKCVRLLNKQLIHPRNKAKRIKFAQEFIENDLSIFDRILWSDETTVRANPVNKNVTIITNQPQTNDNLMINGQVQQGGISVMFWGCFSKLGLGPLIALDGSMNSEKYIKMLETTVVPLIVEAFQDQGVKMVFMQDNAPCHKAKSVVDFLDQNFVETLDWPPQSPDMNPIENLWAIIKQRRQKKFGFPNTKKEIIDQIFSVWEDISEELTSSLAESVIRRLHAVLAAQGGNTKY